MKFVTYMVSGRMLTGVLNPEETWVYPISAAGMEYGSMEEMIRHAGASELEMAEYISRREPYEVPGAVPIGEVKLLAPIPHPAQDVICLGINYMAHAKEAARFQKESFEQRLRPSIFPSA